MTWMPFIVIAVLASGYVFLKRSGQVSTKEASEFLKNGAMVIDVRSESEFNSGHLSQAVNMPLDRIDVLAPSSVRDKNKILLLHCQSGMRSGLAKNKLIELGYKNTYNLGSYDRAAKIAGQR
jgi:phage shock protein E